MQNETEEKKRRNSVPNVAKGRGMNETYRERLGKREKKERIQRKLKEQTR